MLKNYLIQKIKLLSVKNPVLLLDEMNDEEIYFIEEILKDYHNIKGFVLEKNNKKRIFIKLQNLNYETEKNLEGKIHSLYSKKDYELILNKLLEVIYNEENPKPCFYRILAFTYLHLNNINKAIECFIIAEGVSKKTKNRYKFDSLIKKLENKRSL